MTPFPRYVTIDVHDYCDARCSYCPYERLAMDSSRRQGIMSPKLRDALLAECEDNLEHLEALRFGNIAESFVVPEIWDAMDIAISLELPLYIDSNMTRLDAEAMDRLDSWGWAGKLFAHVQPGMGVDLEAQERNYAAAKARWGDRVRRVEIHRPRRWAGDPKIPHRTARRCDANRPEESMIIGWDGTVQLCCVDADRKCVVGSVANRTIAQVWRGAGFRLARTALAEGRNELCNRCEWGMAA